MAKLAIKSDNRKQNLLLPPSLDELVPQNHMVRVVDSVLDRLDISAILIEAGATAPSIPARCSRSLYLHILAMYIHHGVSPNFFVATFTLYGWPE